MDDHEAKSRCHTDRIKEDQIPNLERFETLQELDDIDSMSENITDMIQQSASRVAKAINKPHKSRIPSSPRALMTNRREKAGNGDKKQHAEICHQNESKRGNQEIQP